MKLELHGYVDACSEIVDRAGKELIIEIGLKKIEATWASLNLSFAPYQVKVQVYNQNDSPVVPWCILVCFEARIIMDRSVALALLYCYVLMIP